MTEEEWSVIYSVTLTECLDPHGEVSTENVGKKLGVQNIFVLVHVFHAAEIKRGPSASSPLSIMQTKSISSRTLYTQQLSAVRCTGPAVARSLHRSAELIMYESLTDSTLKMTMGSCRDMRFISHPSFPAPSSTFTLKPSKFVASVSHSLTTPTAAWLTSRIGVTVCRETGPTQLRDYHMGSVCYSSRHARR